MIYVRQMPDGSEAVELLSFPVLIRELDASVLEIRDLSDQFGRISLSDQNAPKSHRRRKGKQALSDNSAAKRKRRRKVVVNEDSANPAAKRKRRRKVVVNEDSANPAETRHELFDLNEYPAENEAVTVHDKYAPANAEAPETSGVKKQRNGKKAVVYQNSAASDCDSSRTISDLPTELTSLNHRQYEEVVNKGTKTKSILKKRSQISFSNDVPDNITRIPLTKRKKVTFNLNEDDHHNNKNKKNKKHTAHKANELLKLNEAEPSNRKGSNGSCGSKTAVRRVRNSKPPKRGPERLKSSHNEIVKEVTCTGLGRCDMAGGCEPSGSDSVVVLAGKVNGSGLGQCDVAGGCEPSGSDSVVVQCDVAGGCEPSGSDSVVVQCDVAGGCEPSGSDFVVVRARKVNGSSETSQARESGRETLVCTVNRNPAEFTPEIAKRFMR